MKEINGYLTSVIALFMMLVALSLGEWQTYYGQSIFMLYAFSGMILFWNFTKSMWFAYTSFGKFFEWLEKMFCCKWYFSDLLLREEWCVWRYLLLTNLLIRRLVRLVCGMEK